MSVKRFFLLMGCLGLLCAPMAAKGLIKFKTTSLSFGEIKSGEVADLLFEFSNTGESSLVIQNINSTCGCTVAQLAKKEYAPGESGAIPVRFFSRGYSGRVTKSITVSSNDEENPTIRLQLTGMVNVTDFADISFSKKELKLGKVPLGKPVRETVSIKNPGNLELRISQVSHTPDLYLIFPKTLLSPGEEIAVVVVYNPTRPGTMDTMIRLMSNALGKGQEMIRVVAEIASN